METTGYLDRELNVAIDAAREAVAAVMEIYDRVGHVGEELEVAHKAHDLGPVTEADMAANSIIVERIGQAFPEDAILAEELADDHRRLTTARFWCIDPLDGTKEFIARNGEFSVMIGLVERATGRPILGVVVEPANDLLMYAVAGKGAFRLLGEGRRQRLTASRRTLNGEIRIIVSRSHPDRQTETVKRLMGPQSVVPCGSVGVKIGRIVQDRADAYLNFSGRTRFWDTCAPDIILEEAGGTLTTLAGTPINYAAVDTVNREAYMATNGPSHEMVLNYCRQAVEETSAP